MKNLFRSFALSAIFITTLFGIGPEIPDSLPETVIVEEDDVVPECHFDVENRTAQAIRISLLPTAQHDPHTMYIGPYGYEVIMRTHDCDTPITGIRARNQTGQHHTRTRTLVDKTIRMIQKITVHFGGIDVNYW